MYSNRKTPNAFLIYRREKQSWLRRNYPRTPQRALSGIVAQMWQNELPATRGKYESIALRLSIENVNRSVNNRHVVPTDYVNGLTHFFVIENVVNPVSPPLNKESSSIEDEFVNSIFNFDA
ncbi:13332_t:CDS:2 [Cetraspora pellucida]|uniref:13332_t:CDS:1 n=1 Tax=Cetraspora pellucida TaxID=1433469 RepID=A0A9N9DEE3_9GLOM|nr:13332_t:CDS:2 [Cetraspora pellucida]